MSSITQLSPKDFPSLLHEISDPPEKLYVAGNCDILDNPDYKYLCVVGSRRATQYGKEVCRELISGLRGHKIIIVSGLALGIDALAHKTALASDLLTIAIPGSGLDPKVLYPRTHTRLAQEIIDVGGALLSEFEPDFKATPWSFPKRNRIMAGLSHATLVIESTEKSGTLITSRLATEYNRDVLTVPSSIFSPSSRGNHMLLRLGATPITSSEDILDALDIASESSTKTLDSSKLSSNEQKVVGFLIEPLPRDELIRQLDLPTHEATTLLVAMELKGLVVERLGVLQRI